MNSRYFICRAKRKYVDAGSRWAYWQLEDTKIVTLGSEVDVDAVLGAEAYWNSPGSDESESLRARLLPTVKTFLEAYRQDGIGYADEDILTAQWELGHDWREIKPDGDAG